VLIQEFTKKAPKAAWSISCSNHGYAINMYNSDLQKVPESTGYTVKKAVEQFVFEKEKVMKIDTQTWPNNSACAR